MPKETNFRKSDSADSTDNRKKSALTRISAENEHESNQQKRKPHSDDSAEMFRGLFTGDEHYHTRSSEFVSLWG
jgi:hypothetical protein